MLCQNSCKFPLGSAKCIKKRFAIEECSKLFALFKFKNVMAQMKISNIKKRFDSLLISVI